MEKLKGKRLLILGGSTWKDAIAEYAKDNGIIIIAAGNNPKAQYFEIARETYNVNSTDAEAMKKLIREKKIDGVYMGSHEFVVTAACDYVKDMGLPCYCTREQWDIFRNKDLFKKFCISAGLPVVPQIKIDVDNIVESAQNLPYPIITKPADGSGSNGFSVCNNADEFLIGYQKACENSASGKVIVEKFVKNSAVVVFYTFSEGKAIFTGIERKYPVKYADIGSYVGGVFLFESYLKKDFRDRFEEKLIGAFRSMGLKEGSLWIEVFIDGNEYYFNEAGYRYGGSVSIYPVDYFYNINQVGADIHYTLTGKSCVYGHNSLIPKSLKRKKYYGIYSLHMKPGTVSEVIGIDEILARKNVVVIPVIKSVGDEIKYTGTFAQVFALVHFVFDSQEELIETVNDIHEKIVVKDTDGNNMVNRMLDVEKETKDFFV